MDTKTQTGYIWLDYNQFSGTAMWLATKPASYPILFPLDHNGYLNSSSFNLIGNKIGIPLGGKNHMLILGGKIHLIIIEKCQELWDKLFSTKTV